MSFQHLVSLFLCFFFSLHNLPSTLKNSFFIIEICVTLHERENNKTTPTRQKHISKVVETIIEKRMKKSFNIISIISLHVHFFVISCMNVYRLSMYTCIRKSICNTIQKKKNQKMFSNGK